VIRNGRDIANCTKLSTQVCVIGSGPAGITTALYLERAGYQVILIDGSRDHGPMLEDSWPDKVLLYNGEAAGLFASNEPDFLILPYAGNQRRAWERERAYGGTSTHWGGQSRPLDPITFEERPGFPGWPIGREDLDPYYGEASRLCKLHGDYAGDGQNFSAEYWAKVLDAQVPHLEGFDVEMYQFVGGMYKNFATRSFDGKTIGETGVDVIRNASLLGIDHGQGSVSRLQVASMDTGMSPQKATEFTIKADAYVLACGAVANARQLLLSNAGNEHDQVGRYFGCHPLSSGPAVTVEMCRRPNGPQPLLPCYLSNDEWRLMEGWAPSGPWKDENGVGVTGRFIPTAEVAEEKEIGRCWFWAGGGQYYFEMTPNPDSRVTLADSKDPVFSQWQTKIDWELSPRDEQTYDQTTALFQAGVKDLGGNVSFLDWEAVRSQLIVNGHHIGTTRMSSDPKKGVVDGNLKVHSLDNLYVAGSSVYASPGISNPTFTIITLSIRLADHLKGALGKPVV
jgi:choline dehydrogenase-like flavoprotein